MKTLSKALSSSTIIFSFLTVFNALYELFQLDKYNSDSTITFFGISIENNITEELITTTFELTIRLVYVYIVYILIISAILYIITFIRRKKE